MPTFTVLAVPGLVEAIMNQRSLFASLASSAFLIHLDPQLATSSVRTLAIAHLTAAGLGAGADAVFGSGYLRASVALLTTIFVMLLLDVLHPPATSTALAFALRAERRLRSRSSCSPWQS